MIAFLCFLAIYLVMLANRVVMAIRLQRPFTQIKSLNLRNLVESQNGRALPVVSNFLFQFFIRRGLRFVSDQSRVYIYTDASVEAHVRSGM
jgi:hypothetical protein